MKKKQEERWKKKLKSAKKNIKVEKKNALWITMQLGLGEQ